MSTTTFRALARLTVFAVATPLALRAQSASPAVASTLTPETYYACYVPNTGTVYRIKTADTPAACAKTTHVEFNWNNVGPQGPQGPQGLQGPQGPAGPAGTLTLPYIGGGTTNDALLTLNQTGTGMTARFQANAGIGVRGVSFGSAGVHGLASNDAAGSAGVRAENVYASGTALDIARGAIKVSGAGLNTNTAIFWTRYADMSPAPGPCSGCYRLTIDHPLANGNPNALLTVTPRVIGGLIIDSYMPPDRLALYYDYGRARWTLTAKYDREVIAQAAAFNILVVQP